MKIEELNSKDIAFVKSVYTDTDLCWDERMEKLMKFFGGKSERTVRRWLVKLGFKEKLAEESEDFLEAKKKKLDKSKKRFIISWAQNNTPVHEQFLKNMEVYAKHINASIHVIAGRYKNPTSVFEDRDEEYWDEVLVNKKYLDANRHNIHKYLSVLGDVKVQPTATNPLSGFESISGDNSCIIGHPRVHLQMIPVLHGYVPKMMLSTGAVTLENYTDSKSGKKGEFHHTLGFVIVEIKNNEVFFVRQVTANTDGEFSDLYYNVNKGKVKKNTEVASLIMGDIHVGEHDEEVCNATFNVLCKKLYPCNIVLHDIFNGHSISHHERDNPFAQFEREQNGTNSLRRELDEMLNWLERVKSYNVVVVKSNHDDVVDKWLINIDWRKATTMKNSKEYMEFSRARLDGLLPIGVVPYVINKRFPKIKCLGRNDSFKVKGFELAVHGDIGASGSRGSINQYRKLNTKICTGHSHQPVRFDGALSVGTSTKLRVGYNLGQSAWLQSHVIIHNDGKAQHINFINGEFTTFK